MDSPSEYTAKETGHAVNKLFVMYRERGARVIVSAEQEEAI